MQRHIALRRSDAIVIFARPDNSKGRHEERLACPFRIGILAIDLVEFLGRLLVILLLVEQEKALVIEQVGGSFGDVILVLVKTSCRP